MGEITADSLPDLSQCVRIPLEPGTAYRFRLTAINGCGLGESSEVSEGFDDFRVFVFH